MYKFCKSIVRCSQKSRHNARHIDCPSLRHSWGRMSTGKGGYRFAPLYFNPIAIPTKDLRYLIGWHIICMSSNISARFYAPFAARVCSIYTKIARSAPHLLLSLWRIPVSKRLTSFSGRGSPKKGRSIHRQDHLRRTVQLWSTLAQMSAQVTY